MGQESDDIVSLPVPPPPNPAARRTAIDTALRRFDGIEDTPPARSARRRPGIFDWASSHRRATGGLVTAALIALVGIPATQIALRDQLPEVASERSGPVLGTAEVEPIQDNAASGVAEPPSDQAAAVPMARNEPIAAPAEPASAKEERLGFNAPDSVQKARVATSAPSVSSPAPAVATAQAPPPPPPPAAPMAERETADAVAAESGNIVVTGQLVRRQNMETAAPATVVTAEKANADFHGKLKSAFRTSNRRAILRLIGFPLRVDFNGDVRTYLTRSDVERDFDRIFTPEVRESVLSGQESRHLTFAPNCSRQPCASGSIIKIRAVRP